MTKETIVQRLLDQGHIVITRADVILNRKGQYVYEIDSLHTDGVINTEEAIILLTENPTTLNPNFPWGAPNTFQTNVPPYQPSQPTWTWPDIYCGTGDNSGTPPNDLGNTTSFNCDCNRTWCKDGPTGNNGSVGTDGSNKQDIT